MTVTYRLDPFTAAYAITVGEAIIGHAYEEAHARQFAAAADMAEALLGLLNYVGGWDVEAADHPIAIARAALAKAEGKGR